MSENYEWKMSARTFLLVVCRFFFCSAIETFVVSLVWSDCDAHTESIRFGQNDVRLIKCTFFLAFLDYSLRLCSKIFIHKLFTLIFSEFEFGFKWLLSHFNESLWDEFAFSANSLDIGILLSDHSFCMWLHRVQFDIERPPQRSDGMWKNYLDHKINGRLRSHFIQQFGIVYDTNVAHCMCYLLDMSWFWSQMTVFMQSQSIRSNLFFCCGRPLNDV